MGFQYLLTNGKSKSCAYHVTLYLCVTVVSVKYLWQKFLRNALSVVCYFNTNHISLVYLLDTNDLVVTCVVYSIVYKVVNDLIQLCDIRRYHSVLVWYILDIITVLLYEYLISSHAVIELVNNREVREFKLRIARLQL